jgi:hypothetical protein
MTEKSSKKPPSPPQPPQNNKILVVDNPTNLPLLPLDDIHGFQGDFKLPPSPEALDKLMLSILDHRLFIGKAVFFENGVAYTEDGHQTIVALEALRKIGYTTCEVVTYALIDGRMQESRRTQYDTIMVPYQVIVPQGDTEESRRRSAAAMLLQINSQYASVNPATSLFSDLSFSLPDLNKLIAQIEIPELNLAELTQSFSSHRAVEYHEKDLKPYKRAHVLLSFPPEKLIDVQAYLEKIILIEGVEYEQGSN